MFMAVQGETLYVFPVGFETVAPWVIFNTAALAFEFGAPPKKHRPVRVVPALQRSQTRLLEDLEQSRRKFRVALAELPLEGKHMHEGKIPFLVEKTFLFGLGIGEKMTDLGAPH